MRAAVVAILGHAIAAAAWHQGPPARRVRPSAARATTVHLKATKLKKAKSKAATAPKAGTGFGATAPKAGTGFGAKSASPAEQLLVSRGRRLVKQAQGSLDPAPWLAFAGEVAEQEEYAEARQVLEAGIAHCGDAEGAAAVLVGALGQMRRTPPAAEVEAAAAGMAWPGADDESEYDASQHAFGRFDTPRPPPACARGTVHPSGDGVVCVSEGPNPILPRAECEWVVSEVLRVADGGWVQDRSTARTVDKTGSGLREVGTDNIWARPFPDRIWLREVPGLLEWFEHRLRTRLFPMLHQLYPAVIARPDDLRCHDAFVVRYDAEGMASLEQHQDTTSFSFTIALNGADEYGGGGTAFPQIRRSVAPSAGGTSTHGTAETRAVHAYERRAVRADVGGVCSFPGRLFHGGEAVTSGYRYIIPLFIYLDSNRSGKDRGYLLRGAGIPLPPRTGVDAHPKAVWAAA